MIWWVALRTQMSNLLKTAGVYQSRLSQETGQLLGGWGTPNFTTEVFATNSKTYENSRFS